MVGIAAVREEMWGLRLRRQSWARAAGEPQLPEIEVPHMTSAGTAILNHLPLSIKKHMLAVFVQAIVKIIQTSRIEGGVISE